MSAITKEQLDNASKFMNEFWRDLVKPYYNPEESDGWWNEMIRKVGDIGNKYCNDDPRLRKMLIGFERGLEEAWKEEGHGRK